MRSPPNTNSIVMAQMQHELSCIISTMILIIPQPEITHEDVMRAFVPEHLREVSLTAQKYFDTPNPARASVTTNVPGYGEVIFTLEMFGDTVPLLPRTFDLDNLPADVGEKLYAYLERRIEVGMQCGMATALFEHFCSRKSWGEMKFYWPAFQVLADKAAARTQPIYATPELLRSFARELRAVRTPNTVPTLPLHLAMMCQPTAGLLTAASMIDEVYRYESTPVRITVNDIGTFKFHDVEVQGK